MEKYLQEIGGPHFFLEKNKNFQVVINKWNSYPDMAQKIHIAKWVFLIFKVTDFCFIDRAWKTNKHKNTAMELRSSILFFAILGEEPIVY